MSEAAERRNVALTGKGAIAMGKVRERIPFGDAMYAAKLGVSYAILKGIEPNRPDDFGRAGDGTNWAVSSIDAGGHLKRLVRVLYPEDERDAYVMIETMMNLGLVALAEDLARDQSMRLSDILTEGERREADDV